MNELMQQTLAGLAAHDRHLVREIRRLVDDVRRIGAEMDVAAAARIELRKCLISECSSLACDAARKLLAGQLFSATFRPLLARH